MIVIPIKLSQTRWSASSLARFLASLFFLLLAGSCTNQIPAEARGGIVFTSDRDGNWEIYWMEPDGTSLTRLTANEVVDDQPDWSADGRMVAFRSRQDGSSDIFIMDGSGKNLKNLVKDPADSFDDEFSPRWHPDGSQLVLNTDRFQPPLGNCPGGRGVHHLAFLPLEGGRERITEFAALPGEQQSADWSPDGKTLAFSSLCGQATRSIYTWEAESGELDELASAPYDASDPAWSADGRWLAFGSTHSGNSEIYLLDTMDDAIRNLTNHPAQDIKPTWSPDGLYLAFTTNRDGNQEIYTLHITTNRLTNLTRHPANDWAPDWSPAAP
jgi:Tol biopolymer transport system component